MHHIRQEFMTDRPLQYYMHDGPAAFRFELAGNLNEEGARRLDQDWRTASSVIGDRCLIVDMTFVTDVDERGRELLARWNREGARLVANSERSRELAEWISGQPVPGPFEDVRPTPAWNMTWRSFRPFVMALTAILFLAGTNAANLNPATVAAWNDYVKAANANLQDRIRPGGSFLWALEDPDRAAKVRSAEIEVAPATGQVPKKIPGGGLIHHWIGALFMPNIKLDDVLAVTRDYDRYKEFYRPSVIESKAIARDDSEDRFSMMLMNKVFYMKSALDEYYRATTVRLDKDRLYSITETVRVQEIEEYGRPSQHQTPEGKGRGYIWKLYSIVRLEQRDGGVYVELEAMALSRDIPAVMHVVVDPIVRRVSRNSLVISLQQTQAAVTHGSAIATTSPHPPAGAGHVPVVGPLSYATKR
jgi:hypothetical protein